MDEFYQNKNDPRYVKYFQRLQLGHSKNEIRADMISNNLDPNVLEYVEIFIFFYFYLIF
jgi:hypothetical protein